MKKILSLSLLILSVFAFCQSKAAEIGVVDSAKLTSEYSRAQQAQKTADEYQEKLKSLVKEAAEELEKFNKVSTNTEAQKIQKQKDAQNKIATERKKIEDTLQKLRDEIYDEVKEAINEEAKAQSLSFVTPSSVALYGGKDITDDVLKRLNASSPASSAKPAKKK